MREIAIHFNAKLDKGNDASTISMDNHKAKGFISFYSIFSGLSVWVHNVSFLSDFKFDWGRSEDSTYYFCYNVKGHFLHQFGDQEEFAKILQNQSMIFIGNPENSVQTVFPANVELKLVLIVIDLKLLGSLDIRTAKRICLNVGKIFEKIPEDRPYRYLGRIDAETSKYAAIVCDNKGVDLVDGLLTGAAVLNMLASQIKVYREDITTIVPHSTLSKSELSKITSLGEYVIENVETSLTVLKLSRHLRISPKKLQMGIQHLYGDSVGHYILNLRLGHAKHLFTTTDLNVSEVCQLVGITSGSYFSKVFKNRYGVLPSQYLKSWSVKS